MASSRKAAVCNHNCICGGGMYGQVFAAMKYLPDWTVHAHVGRVASWIQEYCQGAIRLDKHNPTL
jgi:hypothetical protein